MPGKVRVKILAGRNLPVMDRGSDTTDAYVEIKFGSITCKTDVYRKSLHPQWNSDWFRFEVDDADLQDEPLQIRIMDHDTYSANDAIGKVNISLNPLLLPSLDASNQTIQSGKGAVMSGWLPVYDTMHGIRGEINLIVKVDLFSDVNKFRQSSCGVQFFHSPIIPYGYHAQIIHGFVEELVVNDDPEYQWIDKIRTPRASNEARQVVFLKLSAQVQRKIGLKTIDLGANAVIGYTQCFDLEGDVGVVARGIGTAVTLIKIQEQIQQPLPEAVAFMEESYDVIASPGKSFTLAGSNVPFAAGHMRAETIGLKIPPNSPVKAASSTTANSVRHTTIEPTMQDTSININKKDKDSKENKDTMYRRSSDSDLSVTPKGSSLNTERTTSGIFRLAGTPHLKTPLNLENLDMLEYPFLTLSKYPAGFILQLGATVCARSVKLLERVPNLDEPETRDFWWKELRMEVRSHARALGCNVVLGYTEITSISDDVCVLSVIGTAAIINHQFTTSELTKSQQIASAKDVEKELKEFKNLYATQKSESDKSESELPGISESQNTLGCSLCHIPYSKLGLPVTGKMRKCAVCKKSKVPEVLLATVEIPDNLQIIGRGCLIHAQACRWKRDLKSESNAKEISDGLPFLEYDLQRLLINKLKAKGMNAIFSLRITVAIGEKMMALIGTGTGVYLPALPAPAIPKIVQGNSWTNMEKINELNRSLRETVNRNRETYQLKTYGDVDSIGNPLKSDVSDESDDDKDVDLPARSKNICILEIDDVEDLEIISLILEPGAPDGFHVVNTQTLPGATDVEVARNLQMFTQVWRAKFPTNQKVGTFPKHFLRLLQTIYFKLRSMIPCAICDLKFRLDFPEGDEFQILVNGIALALNDPNKAKLKRRLQTTHNSNDLRRSFMTDEELIFNLEEEQVNDLSHSPTFPVNALPLQERYGVDITPLCYIPGGRIDKYLGNLNFFFIRECTSIRENGGISGFVHSFITEVLAVVRAHITALGGNAMVSFYMSELVLVDNPHKNQGQTLVSVGGDVVFVSYFSND